MNHNQYKYQSITIGSIIRPPYRTTKCPLNTLCTSNVGTTLKQDFLNNQETNSDTIFENSEEWD